MGIMHCGDSMVLAVDGLGGHLALRKPLNVVVCCCECGSGSGEKRGLRAGERSRWVRRREVCTLRQDERIIF